MVCVTFGTAWVYEMPTNAKANANANAIVANCHKMPASRFTRRRLSVEEIVAAWQPILAAYSDKYFIFTVSPIRHLKDGLHENQLSKAYTTTSSGSSMFYQRSGLYSISAAVLFSCIRNNAG